MTQAEIITLRAIALKQGIVFTEPSMTQAEIITLRAIALKLFTCRGRHSYHFERRDHNATSYSTETATLRRPRGTLYEAEIITLRAIALKPQPCAVHEEHSMKQRS